jgi:cysteine desulfurase family protein
MIYLDNAASSFPKAPGVPESVYEYLKHIGASSGRSSHKLALKATAIIFETRELLKDLFRANDSSRFIFLRNATEALNTVIFGVLERGDRVLVSTMEHNAVMRPLHFLASEKGIIIERFSCDEEGYPILEDYKEKLKNNPKLVVTIGCSNVTGTIFPYQEMAKLAGDTLFCIDASQLAGTYPLDLSDPNIDFACFSSHKGLVGPQGVGILYIKDGVDLKPHTLGGTGSRSSSEYQPDFLPDALESGTPNTAGIAGLNAALQFICDQGIANIRSHEVELTAYLQNEIEKLDCFKLYGRKANADRTAILSVTHHAIQNDVITTALNKRDIAVRMGLHCAPIAHKTIGSFDRGGTIRFSPGYFSTVEDIEHTLRVLKEIVGS